MGAEPSSRRHLVVAALFGGLALHSPARFPGPSGWVGAAGLLLVATGIATTPGMLLTPARPLPLGRLAVFAAGLLAMVASVLLWMGHR